MHISIWQLHRTVKTIRWHAAARPPRMMTSQSRDSISRKTSQATAARARSRRRGTWQQHVFTRHGGRQTEVTTTRQWDSVRQSASRRDVSSVSAARCTNVTRHAGDEISHSQTRAALPLRASFSSSPLVVIKFLCAETQHDRMAMFSIDASSHGASFHARHNKGR